MKKIFSYFNIINQQVQTVGRNRFLRSSFSEKKQFEINITLVGLQSTEASDARSLESTKTNLEPIISLVEQIISLKAKANQ